VILGSREELLEIEERGSSGPSLVRLFPRDRAHSASSDGSRHLSEPNRAVAKEVSVSRGRCPIPRAGPSRIGSRRARMVFDVVRRGASEGSRCALRSVGDVLVAAGEAHRLEVTT